MSTSITPQVLQQIEQAVLEDGVWIAPDLRSQISPAVQQQIVTAEAAQNKQGYYVVLVDLNPSDPLTSGNPANLADAINSGLFQRSFKAGTDDYQRHDMIVLRPDSAQPPELELASRVGRDWPGAPQIAKLEHPDDLGAQVLDTLSHLGLSDSKSDATYDKLVDSHTKLASQLGYERTDAWRQSDDDAAGIALAILFGLLGLVVLAVLVFVADRTIRRRALRPPQGGEPAPISAGPFAPPRAVLQEVRATADASREQEASETVLALGEAIDRSSLTATTAGGRAAWQAALDHYDAARRLLDQDHSAADVIGATVLALRGTDALAAARADETWTPQTPCYFNPLHPPAAGDATWSDGPREVDVPACPACRAAITQGKEPADVLDIVDDGLPRHYFRLDLGVWSRTAYGALDSDLLGALLRG